MNTIFQLQDKLANQLLVDQRVRIQECTSEKEIELQVQDLIKQAAQIGLPNFTVQIKQKWDESDSDLSDFDLKEHV